MNVKFQDPDTQTFELDGGCDFSTSHLAANPGSVVAGYNLEMIEGKIGYGRVGGTERCAGDILPSKTLTYFLELETATGSISIGDVFVNGDVELTSLEDYATINDGDYVVFASHQTSISTGVTYSGDTVDFDVVGEVSNMSVYSTEEVAEFKKQAIELTRTNVPEIPGTGDVDGGFRLRGKNYVFRDAVMYEGYENSWTAIGMPDILYFDQGTVEFEVGDTITDGTATATIVSITRQEGSWDSGLDPEDQSLGYFTLSDVSGTFTDDAAITGTTGAAVANGANYTYTISSGGRYETTQPYNFTNNVDSESIFGADGVNDAFEFDGTNYIPIFDPNADTEKPKFVKIHQNRLQLFYPGGVFEYSVSGQPRVYNSLLGAGSYATGSEIVGSHIIHGNAEAVFCGNSTWLLLGDGIYDDETATRNWTFYEHDSNIGATEWSIVERGKAFFVSNGELRYLRATDTTEGYTSEPILSQFQEHISDHQEEVVCSIWCKKKGQYRLFYENEVTNNGVASFVTFKSGVPHGGMVIIYPIPIKNCWSAVEDGVEKMFFISDTGFLYRMDSGNSFDDLPITGFMRTPFYSYGSQSNDKRFLDLTIELDAPIILSNDTLFQYTTNYNYGSPDTPRPTVKEIDDLLSVGSVYGVNPGYGQFVFGGPLVSRIETEIEGYGSNMSVLVTFSSQYDDAFMLRNISTDFVVLGRKRK